MTDRPTPRQIIGAAIAGTKAQRQIVDDVLLTLRAHGYVIAHPDDVPRVEAGKPWPRLMGWNACWDYIFGGDDE